MTDSLKLGQRIHSRREELGLTLKDVADSVGVASSTILRYENGTIKNPKLPVIESIAKSLNVNSSWLQGQTDHKYDLWTDIGELAPETPSDMVLSSLEKQIIFEFRKSDDISKAMVLRLSLIHISEPTRRS